MAEQEPAQTPDPVVDAIKTLRRYGIGGVGAACLLGLGGGSAGAMGILHSFGFATSAQVDQLSADLEHVSDELENVQARLLTLQAVSQAQHLRVLDGLEVCSP